MVQQYYQKSTNVQHFPTSDFKVGNKVFVKAQFFRTIQPSKKLSEKYLGPYEIITQSSTLLFILCLLESMYSVHPVFYMSMLKSTMFNFFSERTQLDLTLVIIDGEPKYEISQIIDFKINHWQACKLLYKIIWLGYKNTKNKSEWIPIFKLTHTTNLISNFHIAYSTKLSPLLLFWSYYYTCLLSSYTY